MSMESLPLWHQEHPKIRAPSQHHQDARVGEKIYFTAKQTGAAAGCERACVRLQEKIAEYKAGKMTLMAGCNEEQSLEHAVMGVLNRIRNTASDVRHLTPVMLGKRIRKAFDGMSVCVTT